MTPALLLEIAISPAARLLPMKDRVEARAMLVASALQETKLSARRQFAGGPARSYWQFEVTGVRGIMRHPATAGHLQRVCAALDIDPLVLSVYEAIEFHDVLACCCARLLLWTIPRPLPGRTEVAESWSQYREAWRPGKPHPEDWPANFTAAWNLVSGTVDA